MSPDLRARSFLWGRTPGSSRARRAALVALALVAVLIASAHAQPQGSTLHEFVPPDPSEDISLSATTLEGDLPAAIRTPSGVATAPDPRRSPAANHVYGGATTDDSPDSTYEPDRDTRRPKVENYDDPFSPATAPFKRLRAYDWVEADYSLRVRDKSLKRVDVGGKVAQGDEPFYGDLSVDLIPGQPVRIPTVGPGSRLLRMHVNPEVPVEVLRDGADNWFVRGNQRVRVRIVVELAIPRATFGSDFRDVEWSALEARGKTAPHLHDAAFKEVAQKIGISTSQRPREVVAKMVGYFRAFAPSEQPPSGRHDIYLDLALEQKGVCRHRAFAFLVTALAIGIPARMVVNEAHAWVEAFDGTLWHRIDLGGAAANLEHEPENGRPPYVPPPDPYAWPESRDSGQDLADRNRTQQNDADAGASGQNKGDAAAPAPSPGPSSGPDPTPANKGPESDVTVSAIDSDVRRGLPLRLQGRVSTVGSPCAYLRVDVMLTGPMLTQGAVIGSLSTDDQGKFDGAVVIPRDFALGDYVLSVVTPGDARCGAGRSK